MRQSSRSKILDAAVALLRRQEAISLESVATEAGLTKPGLMYHFKTKEALMLGLVDHVIDGDERALEQWLAETSSEDLWPRFAAYVRWMMSGEPDESDLVMMGDPKLREVLTARWVERLQPWVGLPDDVGPQVRAKLNVARFAAEGVWFADASGAMVPTDAERAGVSQVVAMLLREARALQEMERGENESNPREIERDSKEGK